MKCPFCSSENTRVIDSRPADDNNSIRRRRLCDDCGKRFTTYEKVETIPLIVPGPAKWMGCMGREFELFIPWCKIVKIGPDIILVESYNQSGYYLYLSVV